MSLPIQADEIECDALNIAGVASVDFAFTSWIARFPEFVDDQNTITNPVLFGAGFGWYRLRTATDSAKYSERQKRDKQGEPRDLVVSCDSPIDDPGSSYVYQVMEKERFIVLYTDKNGRQKLVGTPQSPLLFSSNLETGDTLDKFAGNAIGFTGVSIYRAPFYDV